MNRAILSHRQRLDHLFRKVSSVTDPASQSEWSKYLCVLVSGFIEESLRVLLEEYVDSSYSPGEIKSFIGQHLKNITNCKTGRIIEILSKFSVDWSDDFESQTSQRIKDSINSVVATRHDIAHGKNTGVTYTTISGYYSEVKKAIDILENIVQ